MQRDRQRTGRRFVTLMFLQWIAAVLAAMWFPPVGRWSASQQLLLALAAGGLATACCAAAVRCWPGERRARIVTGLCQMLFAVSCQHLFGDRLGINFYTYGSLVLVSLYADWAVLLAVCGVACGNDLLSGAKPLVPLAAGHLAIQGSKAGELVPLLLCTALLCYAASERAKETAEAREQRERERELLFRAFHDGCTGLPNRANLETILEEWLQREGTVSCLWMEVDGICALGGTFGTRGIDALVRSVADRLQQAVPPADVLGRLGNDKFCILSNRSQTRQELQALAEELVGGVEQPHVVDGRTIELCMSIGIASMPAKSTDRDSLLMMADRAMRIAKSEERNHFRFADDRGDAVDQRNQRLSPKLQRALREGGLRLMYQPIFDAEKQMIAVEALARWNDPEEGEISPAEFVPVAEATGLIVPFSNWVLRRACEQMVEWIALGSTLQRMAVNVSVKQIWRNDFVSTVERTLHETGLQPNHLEVEVTEGALVADFEPVKRNLQALRRLGVRISIDDFGTGYSSLSRVRELEADVLKIDRAFVQGAGQSQGGAAMVQSIIDMAHHLQLSVIAEGVETADQLQLLRGMSCDEIQGFLLGRPKAPEVLTAEMCKVPAAKPEQNLRLVPRPA